MPHDNPTLLDFLRHGVPVGGSRYRGSGIDDPLSEEGWQQVGETTAAAGGWQRIITSPLRRCAEFAHRLAEQRDLPLETQDDLREVGFGEWEGITRAELRRDRRAEYDAFYQDPVGRRPPGAESLDAFSARVSAVIEHLLETYPGEHLLIVAHAGVIRAALGYVTRAPAVNWYRTAVDNAAITRITKDKHGLRLIAHNWRQSL